MYLSLLVNKYLLLLTNMFMPVPALGGGVIMYLGRRHLVVHVIRP